MPEDRLTYLGIRIHDARKACKLTQQELAEEINRFLGKFRACNRSNQLLLLNTLDFLAEQLLVRQNEKCKNTERYDG